MGPATSLIPSLRRWGVLRSTAVEEALERIDVDALLPDEPGRLGHLHAPAQGAGGSHDLTPRLSVLLAELLEIRPGLTLALPQPRPRWLDALARELGAVPHDPVRHAGADRSLTIGPPWHAVPLEDRGFRLRLTLEPFQESLAKQIHTGDGDAELRLDDVPLHPRQVPARPLRHLLVLEGFLRRAIDGRPRSPQDERFLDAVEATWDPAAGRRAGRSEQERTALDAARRWFLLAYIHQFAADLGDALDLYRASVDAFPTAEAHTFLGWVLSFTGDYRAAIRACEAAIAVDAGFGNPYNDIGAYLLEVDQPGQALPWFERALAAPRYDAPHFALCNRGRALLALARPAEAREAFERALALAPGYRPAREYLRRVGGA